MRPVPVTWHQQKKAIYQGQIRPRDLVEYYSKRINEINPNIRALSDLILKSGESPISLIDMLDKKRPAAGLCMVVKDMIDVTGVHCSGGLEYLKGRRPESDADVVARLRSCGASILAVSRSDSGGFGIRTPEVIHPLASDRIVGGSSGGSAAAVAAELVPVALGTDSGGSVRIPAACCNILGFKPTKGCISMNGVLPFSPTLDHIGILAKSIEDIREVMQFVTPFFKETAAHIGSTIRVGISPNYADDAMPEINLAVDKFIHAIKSLNAEIHKVHLPLPSEIAIIHNRIVSTEAAVSHPALKNIAFGALPVVVRKTLAFASTVSEKQYTSALVKRKILTKKTQEAFSKVDMVVVPTLPCLPPKKADEYIYLAGKRHRIDESLRRYTSLFNLTGNPVISIPVKSINEGIGISLQLVGPLQQDAHLLAIVSQLIEQFHQSFKYK